MLIGYARVSKADGSQSLDLQHDALASDGVDVANCYSDRASGKKDVRPGLEACLKALRKGDTLVIWKLDRLGRSLHHLVNTVNDLSPGAQGLHETETRCVNMGLRTLHCVEDSNLYI